MANIVLDFDGVLFDSAFEAYSVCQEVVASKQFEGMRGDVSYVEFSHYRPNVRNAEDFIDLYFGLDNALHPRTTVFLEAFFTSRIRLFKQVNYAGKYFPRCDFFNLIYPSLLANSQRFYILSTRDKGSIDAALKHSGINLTDRIIGQDSIRISGNKINALKDGGVEHCQLYVSDMRHNVDELESFSKLTLMADWGYGHPDQDACSPAIISKIVRFILD
jgi:hypothetical protein